MGMTQRLKKYWYFDSVPTKDLGLSKSEIKETEDEYIIASFGASLETIQEICNQLKLTKNSNGRKLIKDENFVKESCDLLNILIGSSKLNVYGTLFWHSKIPEVLREEPERYKSRDAYFEQGTIGMQGRAYAQTNWCIMEDEVKNKINLVYPVIYIDREYPPIWKSLGFHSYRQLGNGNCEVRVQSGGLVLYNNETQEVSIKSEKARDGESIGHSLAGYLASLLRNKFVDPKFIKHELFSRVKRFDSKIEIKEKTDNGLYANFGTRPISFGWNFDNK